MRILIVPMAANAAVLRQELAEAGGVEVIVRELTAAVYFS